LTDAGKMKCFEFIQQMYEKEGRGKNKFSDIQLRRFSRSALRAMQLRKNQDYVVEPIERLKMTHFGPTIKKENGLVIVDQATGRKKPGSIWSDGLHQFVELKEGIEPSPMLKPGASVTHPFYFNKYQKIFAITGTIGTDTDENEL